MQQEEEEASLAFQPARILKIAKADPDVLPLTKEAAAVLSKATELFVTEVARMASETSNSTGVKQIDYSHVARAVKEWAACDFLEDIVPQKVLGSAVLERIAKEQATENKQAS